MRLGSGVPFFFFFFNLLCLSSSSSADCADDAESTDPGCAAGEAGWSERLPIRVYREVSHWFCCLDLKVPLFSLLQLRPTHVLLPAADSFLYSIIFVL